jgi:hypothetical protein
MKHWRGRWTYERCWRDIFSMLAEYCLRLYVIKKVGFRYRQAESAGIAAVERLKRTAGLASAVTWLGKTHVAKHFGVEKPTQELRSFFSRWSIKFSAEYYEAKERQASGVRH